MGSGVTQRRADKAPPVKGSLGRKEEFVRGHGYRGKNQEKLRKPGNGKGKKFRRKKRHTKKIVFKLGKGKSRQEGNSYKKSLAA